MAATHMRGLHCRWMAESLQDRSERLAEEVFLGGPKRDFERVGRLGFEVLLAEQLRPSSRVLDVGCGALRLGYWLMRFLDPGCYFGIEPQQEIEVHPAYIHQGPLLIRTISAINIHHKRESFG